MTVTVSRYQTTAGISLLEMYFRMDVSSDFPFSLKDELDGYQGLHCSLPLCRYGALHKNCSLTFMSLIIKLHLFIFIDNTCWFDILALEASQGR